MYFEVEAGYGRKCKERPESPETEHRLILAPFSSPPLITFENVPLGETAKRQLRISNPKQSPNAIFIQKFPKINVEFSWTEAIVESEGSILLELSWRPEKVLSQRVTAQIGDYQKGRYEIILILKSITKSKNLSKKTKNQFGVRKSPMKPPRKVKSPKQKAQLFASEIKTTERVLMTNRQFTNVQTSTRTYEDSIAQNYDSITEFSVQDITYDIKNIDVRRETYTFETNRFNKENVCDIVTPVKKNLPRTFGREISILNAIENMEFTPIKLRKSTYLQKTDADSDLNQKLGEKESEFKSIDSTFTMVQVKTELQIEDDTKNATHPIINLLENSENSNVSMHNGKPFDHWNEFLKQNQCDGVLINDYAFHTPNSSFQGFVPHRCSTEMKLNPSENSIHFDELKQTPKTTPNSSFRRLSSETYIKDTSPIVPIDPDNKNCIQSSPYLTEEIFDLTDHKFEPPVKPVDVNMKNFNERLVLRNNFRDKNAHSSARSIIEANLWQRSPPRPVSPMPLFSIAEEPSMLEKTCNDFTNKPAFETFILNKTFDKNNTKVINNGWKKTSVHPPKFIDVDVLKDSQVDVYHAADVVNPFIESSIAYFYDDKAISKLENEFKKWLNYLLTPPSDLDSKLDVDIGKLWIENRTKNIPLAPTKEQVSSKYHTNHRLESLRKSARALASTFEVSQVFLKVSNQVEKKLLTIRNDRNIHLDIGLQKTILNVLLCYNPLWLRIGLEVLHDKIIPLSSNDDIHGISEFIIENVFKIPQITAKHLLAHPNYTDKIKKNTLKKVLFLIYFLDQAKQKKIIFHDPCLFCRNAPFKESKQILFQFTKELLSGVGDITKHLRPTGYVVTHKQTYLLEFKYAVHNLAVDLKDGIRLTRLMEIILMQDDLTLGLRTPAISRLQKVHNVQIALTALKNANFEIVGDITAKDIADGHREKTLSLLWQLINKFRAPLFENSARIIQKWWRKNYLKIWMRKKIEMKKIVRINTAVVKIQSWWKSVVYRKRYLTERTKHVKACIVIQKHWRMWINRSRYTKLKSAIISIQQYYRKYRSIQTVKQQLLELQRNNAAVKIQSWFKKILTKRELEKNNREREYYVQLKTSTVKMQTMFRANLAMKKLRYEFVQIKTSSITIQRFYRSVILTRTIRRQYLELKSATTLIQNRFRANKLMIECRKEYMLKIKAIVCIQKYYRSRRIAKNVRDDYLRLLSAVKIIQLRYRAHSAMKVERQKFLEIKKSAIIIQRNFRRCNESRKNKAANTIIRWYRKIRAQREFELTDVDYISYRRLRYHTERIQIRLRANLAMKEKHRAFVAMKTSAVTIQRFYRSWIVTRETRERYLQLKSAAVFVQSKYRAKKSMQLQFTEYNKMKNAAHIIQSHYRSYRLMHEARVNYLILRENVLIVQRRFRANSAMKCCRSQFICLKSAAIVLQRFYRRRIFSKKTDAAVKIQRWFRLRKLRRELALNNTDREKYLTMKRATLLIQTKFKAHLQMKRDRENFLRIKWSAVKIQNYYRSVLETRRLRREFLSLRIATLIIQNKYRVKKLLLMYRDEFNRKRRAACVIQRFYRNYIRMRKVRQGFMELRGAALCIQRRYRANLSMLRCRAEFTAQRNAAVIIQRRYRARLARRIRVASVIQSWYRKIKTRQMLEARNTEREEFLKLKSTVVRMQAIFRANVQMKRVRNDYNTMRDSAIAIQTFYRSSVLGRNVRRDYLTLKTCVINVQRRFRANNLMKIDRNNFVQIKLATIKIQQYYRSYTVRARFLELKSSAVYIQRLYRSKLLMRRARTDYLTMRRNKSEAAAVIQNWYRKIKRDEKFKSNNADYLYYIRLRLAVTTVQIKYRARIAMKIERQTFVSFKTSTITIQRFYRSYRLTAMLRDDYLRTKKAVLTIQNRFRAQRAMKMQREEFLRKRNAVNVIKQYYKNYQITKQVRDDYLRLLSVTIYLQRLRRANTAARLQRQEYVKMKTSAMIIQRFFRTNRLTREVRTEFIERKNAAVVIQRHVRARNERRRFCMMRYACVQIQQWYRRLSTARRIKSERQVTLQKKQNAAVKIQSCWRGYQLRKNQNDSRIESWRQRWREGALKSKQLTLGARNEEAIWVLSSFKDIASVIRAFKTLDVITSVYPKMYASEKTANCIVRGMILYMNAMNRSVSALETLQLGMNVLINLTRYEPTARYVYSVKCVSTILSLMLRWADKDNYLTCSFSTLLWLFGKYEDIREDLSRYLMQNEQYGMLLNIRQSIMRKKKMDCNKRSSNSTSRNSCTPKKHSPIRYPFTEPDYGIPQSNRPKIFMDELEGLESLFTRYDLPQINNFNVL